MGEVRGAPAPGRHPFSPSRRDLLVGGAAVGLGALAALGVERAVPDPGRAFHLGAPAAGPLSTSVVSRGSPSGRRVALTFDDGPDPTWTPAVLDMLKRHDVRATFFVVGERAAAQPSLVQRQVDEGHEIGSHTYTHADLAATPLEGVREELVLTSDLVRRLIGQPPVAVRPPWGRIDAVGLASVAELGGPVVMWSNAIRTSDAEHDARTTLRDVQPGAIILAHDGGSTPTESLLSVLDGFLESMRERGWSFVPVSAVLDA